MADKIPSIGPIYQKGLMTFEKKLDGPLKDCEFGVQIASDGRVWICVNGEAFIRFRPLTQTYGGKDD